MRFWASASLGLLLAAAGYAQVPPEAQTKPGTHRKFNELTLAGLRPGRDKVAKAIQLFGKPDSRSDDKQTLTWAFEDTHGMYVLNLDLDRSDVVQLIRVLHGPGPSGVMAPKHMGLTFRSWQSGRGLAPGAPCSRVVAIYGEADSRSPSTQGGHKLELLYYAFDWAGADVPQVMEVSCTREEDGMLGQVEEITLAAPSL
jgi:hypothetical protein